jgi:GNAT superfamily N-acetyltransferase
MDATIRAATTEDDVEAWLALRNAVDPRPLTLAGLRAERTAMLTGLDLLAEVDGRAVGAGAVGWGPVSEESRNVFVDCWVLPDHRRNGIGGRLWAQLTTFAREGGMERATVIVLEGDDASLRFGGRRRLRVDGGGSLGHLDLTTLPEDAAIEPIAGVTVSTFSDRPDLEHDVYELDVLVHPEIPFLAGEPMPSFEAWHATGVDDEGFVPGLSLIAVESGRVIGATQIYDSADGTVFIGMTTVHPDARRRGVARHLKRELASRARVAGIRRIETFNDGTNQRIRALNESLGYVYDPPFIVLRGPLDGQP